MAFATLTAAQAPAVTAPDGSRVQVLTRETELTALMASLAVLLMVTGASLSLLWFGRIA